MNELQIKSINDVTNLIPNGISKIEMYNRTQDSQPIADLVGTNFKIDGFSVEILEMPVLTEEQCKERGITIEESPLKDTTKLNIFVGDIVYHSYSKVFNGKFAKAINIFSKDDIKDLTFNLLQKTKNGKSNYLLTIVEDVKEKATTKK